MIGKYKNKKTGEIIYIKSYEYNVDGFSFNHGPNTPTFILTTQEILNEWGRITEQTWSWGNHCWHDWKEYPLFTSVEIRCSKCGKLKEDEVEAEDAHKG